MIQTLRDANAVLQTKCWRASYGARAPPEFRAYRPQACQRLLAIPAKGREMTKVTVRPPDLPATIDEWVRKSKAGRSVNDEAEDTLRSVVNGGNADFMPLINAVHNKDAVEGSIVFDNAMAAKMLRDHAREIGMTRLANADLATISRALGVALRRYSLDRTTRRKSVGFISPPVE
jgi:hypothetical protein